MYFDQLLGAAPTQKLVKLLFSAVFNLFVDFKPFSVISRLKSTKNIWKWTKKKCLFFHILPAPQSWLTCKSWSTPWGNPEGLPQICLNFLLLLTSIHESCPLCLLVSLRKVLSTLFGSWPRYSYEAKNRTTEYEFDIFGALLLYIVFALGLI